MQEPRNPFELMMNPAGVLEAIERSQRLAELHSRVYRPTARRPRQTPSTAPSNRPPTRSTPEFARQAAACSRSTASTRSNSTGFTRWWSKPAFRACSRSAS
jgi:hypothetical protein